MSLKQAKNQKKMPQPMLMHRMDVILLNKYKDNLITELHKAGVTQINFIDDKLLKEHDVSRNRPLERATTVSKNIIRTNRILGSLKQFDLTKVSFLEGMLGIEKINKVNVGGMTFEKIIDESNILLSGIEPDVSKIDGELEALTSGESEISKNIEECKLCPKDVNAEDLGEEDFLYTIAGVTSGDAPKIENELKENFRQYLFESYALEAKKGDEKQNSILIAVMKSKKQELDDLLNRYSVRILKIEGSGNIGELLKELTSQLTEIKAKKEELKKQLNKIYNKYYQKLLVSKEMLDIEKDRCDAFVAGAATENASMLRFWVPENESKRIHDLLVTETQNFCEISVKKDLKDAPVILNNHKFIKPFEFLTEMYGRPKYGNLDPTIFVVPFIILFIGMMIADVVTGIILVTFGIYMYKKYGPYSRGVKNLMTLIILCGGMAMIVGISTGEYFGNLLHHYLLPSVHLPGKIFDPQGEHLYLFLQFAIILGLCHLILGTLLGFYNELRHGKMKDGILEYFSWSLFGFGLGIIFLSKNTLSDAFMFGSTTVSAIPQVFGGFIMLGVVLIVVGLVLAFMKHKLMILIEFIDFFAFTLSYARITALLIAAGAVAAAFNMLAAMAWSAGPIGPILGVIVFAIAHSVAMFLAILDGFVQSLRLVYVEHFSRYYQGGGSEFKAFKAARKYTLE